MVGEHEASRCLRCGLVRRIWWDDQTGRDLCEWIMRDGRTIVQEGRSIRVPVECVQ